MKKLQHAINETNIETIHKLQRAIKCKKYENNTKNVKTFSLFFSCFFEKSQCK